MRKLLTTLVLAAALALGACGGQMTKQEITTKAAGITAKADLEKKLGKPTSFTKIGPIETWTYKASDGDVVFLITGDTVRLDIAGGGKPEKGEKK
jgi:hypothetical protein